MNQIHQQQNKQVKKKNINPEKGKNDNPSVIKSVKIAITKTTILFIDSFFALIIFLHFSHSI